MLLSAGSDLAAGSPPDVCVLYLYLTISIYVNTMPDMKRITDPDALLLHGAADPTRLAILRQLAGGSDVCACDFTACCEVAQPTVSHHLKVLREAGWVRSERRASFVYYTLVQEAVERFRAIAGGLGSAISPPKRRALPVVQPPA